MSFTGTQQKCKVCEKTVYPVEQLSADGIAYHKSCFKCSHCKGMLELSNYSSMEGVLYCKPHFEQLFKETAAKLAENLTPDLTRSPSKAASMFSGTQEKCATYAKTAHPLEKTLDGVADSAGEDNRNHNLHQEILMGTEETVTLEENIEDLHSLHREMKALFDAPAAPKEVLFSTLAAGKNRTEVVQKLCQITDLVSDGVLRIKQLPEDIRSYRKKDIVLDLCITKGDKF